MRAWIAAALVAATVMLAGPTYAASEVPTVGYACVYNEAQLPESEVTPVIAAVQKQIDNEFAAAWHGRISLGRTCYPHENQWTVVLKEGDGAFCNCYGYHNWSREQGVYGVVFTKTDQPWSITFSHEVLEMIVNPKVRRIALNALSGVYFELEIGDPVEIYHYTIDGIEVSDFVYPAWFHVENVMGPWDQMGKVNGAFQSYDDSRPATYEPVKVVVP